MTVVRGVLTWRVLLLEWLGTLLLLLLGFAWLQIADSHIWQFAFSIVSGVLLVIAFFLLQATVFRILLRRSSTLAPFWKRFLICLAVLGLWLLLLQGIGAAREHAPLYAGYWNSKLSPGLRSFFTYERLVSLQRSFWSLLQWALAALLLPVAVEGGAMAMNSSAGKRIGGIYRHWPYWLAAIVCGFAGSAIVGALVNRKPGDGVGQQIASAVLRVGLAYTVVILLWCFVVSLAAVYPASDTESTAS